MLYFSPIHDECFKHFSYGYPTDEWYWPPMYIRTDEITDQTIIDKWSTIPLPPAPRLKSAAVDARTTALLILDIENSICKSPRCIGSIPAIKKLLTEARKNGMLVIYSLIPKETPQDINSQIAPLPGDRIVKSNVDKFYQTSLEEILRKNGIRTVIVTGYAANGAVLHTATGAAIRSFNVIIPVDCMSADNPYAEQYTAWHMLNAPGTRNRAVLTKVDLISFLP